LDFGVGFACPPLEVLTGITVSATPKSVANREIEREVGIPVLLDLFIGVLRRTVSGIITLDFFEGPA